MKAEEMAEVLTTLAILWPNADVERRAAGGLAMMCAELPKDAMVLALRELALTGREFPPPPGVVRKWVEDHREMSPEEEARALGYRTNELGRMRE